VNVEQRLQHALRSADRVEPSPDLWARVVHSIEEDQAHRRRVLRAGAGIVAMVAGLVAAAIVNLTDSPFGSQVRLGAMELIETVALVILAVALGPAIRRFGRGYAHDLWRTTPDMPTSLLRLLDVAYALVFSGYILLTASFDFGRSLIVVGEQIEDLSVRVAGLLLTMGLLHAATIMTLPLIALVSNSTRVGRKLPRWVVVLLVLMGLGVGFVGLQALAGGIGASL
jgi:hypothetical protein